MNINTGFFLTTHGRFSSFDFEIQIYGAAEKVMQVHFIW